MKHNSLLAKFERHVEQVYPDIVREIPPKNPLLVIYHLTVNVECYSSRRVSIYLDRKNYRVTKITTDGPTSKHRYGSTELCIWNNKDDKDNKWVYQDGLLALIRLIEAHLFREAYWRETGGSEDGEWLGPESQH